VPSGALRIGGTSLAARISDARVHSNPISTAARFGFIAGSDDTYDFRCDVGHPFGLNYEMAYGVFAVITVDRFSIITRFET
jgi:hypothetical protein